VYKKIKKLPVGVVPCLHLRLRVAGGLGATSWIFV